MEAMQDYALESRGIAYRTNTFAEGRTTLIFIHGLSGSSSAWVPYEKEFESTHNVVTYDLRGHGLSKKYARYEDYELQHFGDDLVALLEHLKIENCSLVAHSMGTTIALLFLLKHSSKVESALFLAPDYRVHALLRSRITKPLVAVAVLLLKHLPFSSKTGHRLDYSNFGYSPDWSPKRIYPEIRDMGLRLYLYCLQHMYQFTHDDWWEKLSVPVRILHGTRDTFVPLSHSVRLAEQLPQTQLIRLESANHMLVLNNKAEIVTAIKDFIK